MTENTQDFSTLMAEVRSKFKTRGKRFDLWMASLDTITAVGELKPTATFNTTRIHIMFMASSDLAEEFYSLYKEANDAHWVAAKQLESYMRTLKTGGENDRPA